jgi:hypothetical protein
MPDAQKSDLHGWYRVHAIDGSGLDYSTTVYDPERHVIVADAASDEHGRPYPAAAAVVAEKPKTADKASVNKPEEATK